MKRSSVLFLGRLACLTLLLMLVLPVATYAQRRHRSRVVIYQPRSYVIYQQRPVYRYRTYSYSSDYYPYSSQYYSSSYSQPYYSSSYSYNPSYVTRYYNYGYRQPYYVNRYTWAAPAYRSNYYDYGYRPRYRRSGFRIGINLR